MPRKAVGNSGRYFAARIRNLFQKVFQRGLFVGQATRRGAQLPLIENQRQSAAGQYFKEPFFPLRCKGRGSPEVRERSFIRSGFF